jgi:hypothetical protein
MPLEARRWKLARKRLMMSNKIRYRSSVAMAVPVCWLNRRDEMSEPDEGDLVKEDDGPGR